MSDQKFRYLATLARGAGDDYEEWDVAVAGSDISVAAILAVGGATECGAWVLAIAQDDDLEFDEDGPPVIVPRVNTSPRTAEPCNLQTLDNAKGDLLNVCGGAAGVLLCYVSRGGDRSGERIGAWNGYYRKGVWRGDIRRCIRGRCGCKWWRGHRVYCGRAAHVDPWPGNGINHHCHRETMSGGTRRYHVVKAKLKPHVYAKVLDSAPPGFKVEEWAIDRSEALSMAYAKAQAVATRNKCHTIVALPIPVVERRGNPSDHGK